MNTSRLLRENELKELRKFFLDEMGIDILNYRRNFLSRRFLVRALSMGFEDFTTYIAFAKKNESEKNFLKGRLFVPTTELFRNRDVFEKVGVLIEKHFDKSKVIKILSAPCSSGEEAISLSILLRNITTNYLIIGIDRNKNLLKEAKEKKFSKRAILPLYKNEIKMYLKEVEYSFCFKEHILGNILFVLADILKPIPLKGIDIAFIRNFFIYLTDDAQQKCIENMKKILLKGSFMVFGKVERVKLDKREWEVVDVSSRIYRYKGADNEYEK